MIRRHPSSRHATPYFGQGPVSSRSSRFDVLVTNAGVPSISVFEGTRMARAREVFEINTFGVIATTQAVLSQFRERGSGVVVDVTSTVVLGQMSLSVVCKASKMPPGRTGSCALRTMGREGHGRLHGPGPAAPVRTAHLPAYPLRCGNRVAAPAAQPDRGDNSGGLPTRRAAAGQAGAEAEPSAGDDQGDDQDETGEQAGGPLGGGREAEAHRPGAQQQDGDDRAPGVEAARAQLGGADEGGGVRRQQIGRRRPLVSPSRSARRRRRPRIRRSPTTRRG